MDERIRIRSINEKQGHGIAERRRMSGSGSFVLLPMPHQGYCWTKEIVQPLSIRSFVHLDYRDPSLSKPFPTPFPIPSRPTEDFQSPSGETVKGNEEKGRRPARRKISSTQDMFYGQKLNSGEKLLKRREYVRFTLSVSVIDIEAELGFST